MGTQFKAVVFDMDGLMFDTETQDFAIHSDMSRRRGKVFTHAVQETVTGKRAHDVMSGLNEFWGKGEKVADLLAEQDELLIKAYKDNVAVMPGLRELISRLETAKIRLAIGTSSRGFLVDVLLKKHQLVGAFEVVITGDMVSRGKPDPEIYDLCLQRLGLEPQFCAILEDSVNGVSAGKASGSTVIAVPSELTKMGDFSAAHYLVSSLGDQKLFEILAV